MKQFFGKPVKVLFILSFIGNVLLTNASSIEVKDTIWVDTVWDVDTVKVTGDLYLPADVSLLIQPGTRVEFQGYYEFTFDGFVEAIGEPGDSIVFTINDTTGFHDITSTEGGWKGLKGDVNIEQLVYFKYCIFEYAKNINGDYAIAMGKPWGFQTFFNFNIIRNNYAKISALYIGTYYSGVGYCIFQNNLCSAVSAGNVYRCDIINNEGTGILLIYKEEDNEDDPRGSLCINNKIENNKDFAVIVIPDIDCQIAGSRINNNAGGVLARKGRRVRVFNNMITNNNTFGAITTDSTKLFDWVFGNLIYNNAVKEINPLNPTGAVVSINAPKEARIYNNTISKNLGVNTGGLTINNFKKAEVYNNILWENKTIGDVNEIAFMSDISKLNSKLSIYSNLINQGNNAIKYGPDIVVDSGTVLSSDPQFENYLGYNFLLNKTSPCIDKGINIKCDEFYELPGGDVSGAYNVTGSPGTSSSENYRIIGNIIDIGAYEYKFDSMLVYNVAEDETIVLCNKDYKSAYLRSNVYWDPYNYIEPITYQWQKNGKNIEGAVYSDLLIKNYSDNDPGKYSVIIEGHYDGTDTINYYVTRPKLGRMKSKNITAVEGSDTLISLCLLDKDVSFQWYKDGIPIDDTNKTLQLEAIKKTDEGFYNCSIYNECVLTETEPVFVEVLSYCEVNPLRDTTIYISICKGYEFNNQYITTSGIYNDTIQGSNGCDSVVTLNLTILPPNVDTIKVSTCNNYEFYGDILNSSGFYQKIIVKENDCDSIIVLNLELFKSTIDTIYAEACKEYNFLGKIIKQSGIYSDTLITIHGCDSIIILNLTILEPIGSTITATICNEYNFNGEIITKSGVYYDTLVSAAGCDSIIQLNLTIANTVSNTLTEIACYYYDFNGKKLSKSGIYYDTLISAAGCDSILILNLTIPEVKHNTICIDACMSYDFNGEHLTKSGIYYDTLVSESGCDSIVQLILVIEDILYREFNITTCTDYIYNGKTYTQSGTFIDTADTETGCISIVTLNISMTEIDTSVICSESGLTAVVENAELKWVRCDSGYIEVPDAINSTFNPDKPGVYAAIINKNGCSDTTRCFNYLITGLNNIESSENVLVYPNPFNISTTISISNSLAEIEEIRLINMVGEEVFKAGNINNNTYKLYNNGLVQGNYVALIICSDNNIIRKRIIVE